MVKTVKAGAEDIRVTSVLVGICVLPDGLERPASGDGAVRGAPGSEHERVGVVEGAAVAGASLPPAWVGVEHGIAGGLAVVVVAELLDPGDHGALAQAPACSAAALALEIEHTGESDAVT